jgi:hypothetical protein
MALKVFFIHLNNFKKTLRVLFFTLLGKNHFRELLRIIDISDLANPTLKSSYDTPDDPYRVAFSGNYVYVANKASGLQIINPNLDKVTLLGTASSTGTHRIDIKACNEIMECVTDSFNIIVTNLTVTLIIICASTGTVCTVSVCCTLIGGGIIILKRRHNKILKDKININAKEKENLLGKKNQKFLSMI